MEQKAKYQIRQGAQGRKSSSLVREQKVEQQNRKGKGTWGEGRDDLCHVCKKRLVPTTLGDSILLSQNICLEILSSILCSPPPLQKTIRRTIKLVVFYI